MPKLCAFYAPMTDQFSFGVAAGDLGGEFDGIVEHRKQIFSNCFEIFQDDAIIVSFEPIFDQFTVIQFVDCMLMNFHFRFWMDKVREGVQNFVRGPAFTQFFFDHIEVVLSFPGRWPGLT